jgi:hypothetical protein
MILVLGILQSFFFQSVVQGVSVRGGSVLAVDGQSRAARVGNWVQKQRFRRLLRWEAKYAWVRRARRKTLVLIVFQIGRVRTSLAETVNGKPSSITVSLGLPASRTGLSERLRL